MDPVTAEVVNDALEFTPGRVAKMMGPASNATNCRTRALSHSTGSICEILSGGVYTCKLLDLNLHHSRLCEYLALPHANLSRKVSSLRNRGR